MFEKIHAALHEGLSKEEYDCIKPIVEQQNRKTLQWLSLLLAALMAMLVIITSIQLIATLTVNRPAYCIVGILSLLIFFIARFLLPNHLFLTTPCFYIFLVIIILFSIYIGIITNVDQRASTICVLLLAIPLAITDRPFRITVLMSVSVLLFCIMSYQYKDRTLFAYDMINCVSIFIISIGVNIAQQNMKYRTIHNSYIIEQNHMQMIHRQKMELEENRISIMLSQIQPHFLFNSLLVIEELCATAPDEARQATVEFSKFLRGNLDSLSTRVPIPFTKEMEHTKNYLSLEQKRFGKRLKVEWEIMTTAFMIPALTLQPIVENAVRYGITKKKDGGTVKISTEETKTNYVVVVWDDGLGFDVNKPKEDGRTHIGIANVEKRLADMCGGELVIESREGLGTVARIIIPKGGSLF